MAKSLMPGCATSSTACRPPVASRTTKRCCRGIARQRAHPDRPAPSAVGGVYGAVTKHLAESKNQPKPLPVAEIRRAEPQTDWNKVVEEQARRDAMSQPKAELPASTENTVTKQTVFNDANYTPRGADNVLPVEKNYKPVEQEKPAKKLKVTVIKETKDTTCWPLREGSVARRNCKANVNLSRRN